MVKKDKSKNADSFIQLNKIESGRCVQKMNFRLSDIEVTNKVHRIARFPAGKTVILLKKRELEEFFDLKI